ncbi:MAG: M1 family metallopeptidase [Deltaproteobacteria bacterium]|nr:M1 family metallopeptidase [Deltaproteobacteria bacterium]
MSASGFRLPRHAKPLSYDIDLDVSLRRPRFSGQVTIALQVLAPKDTVTLHARDLAIQRASATVRGRTVPAAVEVLGAQQAITLRFPKVLARGKTTLRLQFTGVLSPSMHGLYLAKDGADTAIVSQCEAADARAIFPCFDEPDFKARLRWLIRTDPGLTVVTNGVATSVRTVAGRAVHRFKPTRVISTYLAAVTIGRYRATKPIQIGAARYRTLAVAGKEKQTEFAAAVTRQVLPWYQRYFKARYPYQKLDQVAVPGFDAGAMENVGAVFYRQNLLLMQAGATSWHAQKRIAEVIAHELAHMWFGNLVTMRWWDDLWLNEAFASFMAYKAIDLWKPEWRIWDDFLEASHSALSADALDNTHPIYAAVKSPAEATELFDVITYEKGCAVLRMAERYLGEEVFKDGLRRYVATHADANARGADLWAALAAASKQPVARLMRSWIEEPGFPLLSVSMRKRDGKTLLHLRQRRFFANREAMAKSPEQCWHIPIVIRVGTADGVHTQRLLMTTPEAQVPLDAELPVAWCYPNADAAGFYRMHFDDETLARLLEHGLRSLSPAERMSVVEDQWALVKNGLADIGRFMDVVQSLAAERDHMVTRTLAMRIGSLDDYVVREQDRPRFAAFVRRMFGPQLDELRFEPLPDESPAVAVRRAVLAQLLGRVGRDPGVIGEAKRRQIAEAKNPTAAEPNLAGTIVQIAALEGDRRLLASYLATYNARRRARMSPELQSRYIAALSWFEDLPTVKQIHRLVLDDTLPQDQLRLVLAPMLGSRQSGRDTWTFLKTHWTALAPKVGAMGLARLVEATGGLPVDLYDDVAAFFAVHPVEEATRALKKALESMRLRRELCRREAARLGEWLQTAAPKSRAPTPREDPTLVV